MQEGLECVGGQSICGGDEEQIKMKNRYRNKAQGKGCGQRIAEVVMGVTEVCLPNHLKLIWVFFFFYREARIIVSFLRMST